jgi:hypothetical protein
VDDDTYVAAVSPRSLKTEEASGAGRVLLLGSVSSIATDGEWAERGAQLKDPDRSAWDIGDWWASGDHLGYGARKKIIEGSSLFGVG